jgi:hypothetical protein
MNQIHRGEVIAALAVVVLLIICIAPVVWKRWRSKRSELPRLRHIEPKVGRNGDWRFLIPPEFRTEATGRLFQELR